MTCLFILYCIDQIKGAEQALEDKIMLAIFTTAQLQRIRDDLKLWISAALGSTLN